MAETKNKLKKMMMEDDGEDKMKPPPAAVPFSRLFACADWLDWFLMAVGSLGAAAHGTTLVFYLHYFAKIIQLFALKFVSEDELHSMFIEVFHLISLLVRVHLVLIKVEKICSMLCLWIIQQRCQNKIVFNIGRPKYISRSLNSWIPPRNKYAKVNCDAGGLWVMGLLVLGWQ